MCTVPPVRLTRITEVPANSISDNASSMGARCRGPAVMVSACFYRHRTTRHACLHNWSGIAPPGFCDQHRPCASQGCTSFAVHGGTHASSHASSRIIGELTHSRSCEIDDRSKSTKASMRGWCKTHQQECKHPGCFDPSTRNDRPASFFCSSCI